MMGGGGADRTRKERLEQLGVMSVSKLLSGNWQGEMEKERKK